jgi:hypothetical protein
MVIDDYKMLDYLHDALLVDISFFVGPDGLRRLRLVVVCHEECGHDAWAGNTVEVLFVDTLVVHGSLVGYMCGEEYFDRVVPGLIADAEHTVALFTTQGAADRQVKLTLVLHSGSELAVACSAVEVAVRSSS